MAKIAPNKREQWLVANVTNRPVNIPDLSRVPTIRSGRIVNLLQYETRERISQSWDLENLLRQGSLRLKKKWSTKSRNVKNTEVKDALSPRQKEFPAGVISQPTTLYVSRNGNDTTGNGSRARPFRQFSKAMSILSGQILQANVVIRCVTDGEFAPFEVSGFHLAGGGALTIRGTHTLGTLGTRIVGGSSAAIAVRNVIVTLDGLHILGGYEGTGIHAIRSDVALNNIEIDGLVLYGIYARESFIELLSSLRMGQNIRIGGTGVNLHRSTLDVGPRQVTISSGGDCIAARFNSYLAAYGALDLDGNSPEDWADFDLECQGNYGVSIDQNSSMTFVGQIRSVGGGINTEHNSFSLLLLFHLTLDSNDEDSETDTGFVVSDTASSYFYCAESAYTDYGNTFSITGFGECGIHVGSFSNLQMLLGDMGVGGEDLVLEIEGRGGSVDSGSFTGGAGIWVPTSNLEQYGIGTILIKNVHVGLQVEGCGFLVLGNVEFENTYFQVLEDEYDEYSYTNDSVGIIATWNSRFAIGGDWGYEGETAPRCLKGSEGFAQLMNVSRESFAEIHFQDGGTYTMPWDAADTTTTYISATLGGTIEVLSLGSYDFVCSSELTGKTFCGVEKEAIIDFGIRGLEIANPPLYASGLVNIEGFHTTFHAGGAYIVFDIANIYNDHQDDDDSVVFYAERGGRIFGLMRQHVGGVGQVNWDYLMVSDYNSLIQLLFWGTMRQKTAVSADVPMLYADHGGMIVLSDLVNGAIGGDLYKGTNGIHIAALNTGRVMYGSKANKFDGGAPDIINGDGSSLGLDTDQGTYIKAIQDASWM